MNDKIYFIPDDPRGYSFEEITALIFDGKLLKNSMIWEKSLPDWVPIAQNSDFDDFLKEYERLASEKVKRILGTDEAAVKQRKMKSLFETIKKEEEEKQESKLRSNLAKKILIGSLIIILPLLLVVSILNFGGDKPEKAVKTMSVEKEKLNIRDVRFGSGIVGNEIVGLKIKKITQTEEDKILKEVIWETKKKQTKNSSKNSIFNKVSDEELKNFRNSFMSKMSAKTTGGTLQNSNFAEGKEELTSRQLSETIRKNYGSIKYCYDKSLKRDFGISGKMEVTVHILGNGKVAKVITETSKFKGTEMEQCVKEKIKKWSFPQFNGELSTVTIPFILTAQ